LLALQSAFKLSFGLFYTFLHFFTLQAPTAAAIATGGGNGGRCCYWPVVCCLWWVWEQIGGTKRELLALQSAFKLSFGLFYTFLHFFTLQAPTVVSGATEEVRVCAVDTGW